MSSHKRRPASPMQHESLAFAAEGMSAAAHQRKVFVVGLHRSGTSILAELLKGHPSICGHDIAEMPPELENEGQHVQVWLYCQPTITTAHRARASTRSICSFCHDPTFADAQLIRAKIPSQHQSTRTLTLLHSLNRSLTHSFTQSPTWSLAAARILPTSVRRRSSRPMTLLVVLATLRSTRSPISPRPLPSPPPRALRSLIESGAATGSRRRSRPAPAPPQLASKRRHRRCQPPLRSKSRPPLCCACAFCRPSTPTATSSLSCAIPSPAPMRHTRGRCSTAARTRSAPRP